MQINRLSGKWGRAGKLVENITGNYFPNVMKPQTQKQTQLKEKLTNPVRGLAAPPREGQQQARRPGADATNTPPESRRALSETRMGSRLDRPRAGH